MSKTYSKTRILVECALMIAIGTVLSNIKFFTMPNGGSITLLSMLPFVLVSFRHGAKWGLFTGFVNACLQMIMGFYPPPASTFLYFLGEVLLDYVLAFMALGLAELFARPFKNRTVGVAVGTFAAGFTLSLVAAVGVAVHIQDGRSGKVCEIFQILFGQIPAGEDQVDAFQPGTGVIVPQRLGRDI